MVAVLTSPFYAQQVNQDIIPASPGLNLGHSNQRWNGFFNTVDIHNLTINGSPINAGGIGPQLILPNGVNCTTANRLVEFDGSGAAQTATLGSTKVIGVAISGAGCSGNVTVQYAAITQCQVDGTTTINDKIAASNTVQGECMDIGPTSIAGVQTVGIVTQISSGAGTLSNIDLFTGDTISPSSSSGSVSVPACSNPFAYAATIGSAVVNWDCNTSLDGSGDAGFKQVTVTGSGAGKIDFGTSSAPANPGAGFFRLYGDSGTGFLTCLTSSGGNCLSTGVAFSAITGGTNTNAVMKTSTTASLSPTNPNQASQVISSGLWLQPGLAAPSASSSNSGGSLLSGHAMAIVYTLNSALGETLASAEVSGNNIGGFGGGCTSGGSCSITVTAPTIPTGYTGYTVYSKDCGTLPCTGELRQTASSNCVNITINCVIQVGGAGAAVPTLNTAVIAPPNNTAAFVPAFASIPSLFFPKTDGNFYPLAGMDFSSGGTLPTPDGTFEFWHRLFVNDSGVNLVGSAQTNGGCIKNALFSVCHQSGNTTSTGSSVDDRAIAFRNTDSASAPTYEQFLGLYGEAFTYNNNFACNPTGSPMVQEDCFAALRVRANDQRTTGVNNIQIVGIHGTASTNVAAPKLGSCQPCVAGIVGTASQETVNSQNGGGAFYAGVVGSGLGSSGNSNGTFMSFYAKSPATRFSTSNMALFVDSGFTNAADFIFRIDGTAKSYFKGPIDLDSLNPLNSGTITMGGSVKPMGLGTQQLNSNGGNLSVGVVGTPGATTDTYKVVYKDVNGATAAASNASTTNAANATLNGSNFNRLTLWSSGSPQTTNCPTTIDIYRTVAGGTPSTTGKIGTFTVTDCTSFYTGQTFDDTGLAGDSTTPPTVNSTGSIQSGNYLTSTNCAATGTAANPSVASCSVANAGSFSCATNASTGTCVVNTTAVTANSEIFITQRSDTTTGTRLGVTCNATLTTAIPEITAVTAGTSFTINLGTITTNPECFSYFIVN